jgi:hypothetical protein
MQRVHRDGGVPMIGNGNQRGVHFLHVERLAILVEGARGGAELLGFIELHVPDIAQRDDVDAQFHEVTQIAAAALATTDQRHLDTIVGAHHARIRKRGGGRYAPQKCAPCDVVVWHIRALWHKPWSFYIFRAHYRKL